MSLKPYDGTIEAIPGNEPIKPMNAAVHAADLSQQEKEAQYAQQMQEQLEQLKNDPIGFYKKLHDNTVGGIDQFTNAAHDNINKGMNFYFGNFKRIIELQSQELALHRAAEHYIRNSVQADEAAVANLEGIYKQIDVLREQIKQQAQLIGTMQGVRGTPQV